MIMQLLKFSSYITLLIFIAGISYRWWRWSTMPIHLRWELYPVPHEAGKAEYGGGYLEEASWWSRGRKVSTIGELKELLKEMLFIKRIYNNNRRLWALSYSFHLGIYLILVWFLLILLGAVTIAYMHVPIPSSSPWATFLLYATLIIGGTGDVLGIIGGVGLLTRRLINPVLRDYTTWPDYLNLILVLLPLISGMVAWTYDPYFNLAREFMVSLVSASTVPYLPPAVIVNVVFTQVLIAYIPFTKITHFIGKYFTYHKVLWDDEPNLGQLDDEIGDLTALRLPWNATHIKHGESWEGNVMGGS
ncbi:MAG: respiratory nitrate reductase subunit gamma [Vulcanisaeta sp.]|jgi:nitrate reductase gamma subunit